MNLLRISLLVTLASGLAPPPVHAALSEALRTRLEAAGRPPRLVAAGETLRAAEAVRRVYEANLFDPIWVDTRDGRHQAGDLLDVILDSEFHGMVPYHYHLIPIRRLLETDPEGLDLELLLTDAFLLYASHALSGRLNPETIDPEWFASPRSADLIKLLRESVPERRVRRALEELLPPQPGYRRLREALLRYRTWASAHSAWPEVETGPALRQGDDDARVARLRTRLAAEGFTAVSEEDTRFDEALHETVVRYQGQHGLDPDGVVGRATLEALAIPPAERARQIEVNLERWRWLPQDLGDRHIRVNIADFSLEALEEGRTVLEMKAIVGRDQRHTPVFSAEMTYVVLNPFWNVPTSIAGRDLLPQIRKDPGYIQRMGFQVFQHDGREIAPQGVNWSGVSGSTYRLRQRPGPQNALGRMKFMFPNRFSVYLHDTPARDLFGQRRRAFSSGCIRLEKPDELLEFVLARDRSWNREKVEEILATGKETTIPLARPVSVHLLHWTTWVEENGTIHFRDDLYGRDARVAAALDRLPAGRASR